MIAFHLDWLNRWHAQQAKQPGRDIVLDALPDGTWQLKVPLDEKTASAKAFTPVKVHRTETNWLHCKIEGDEFQATAGPRNLCEALKLLRQWSDDNKGQEAGKNS